MRCIDCPDLPNGTNKRQICCRREGATLVDAGHVGVPGPGERVCPRCRGNGKTMADLAGSYHASFAGCDKCDGTGVVKIKVGDVVPLPERKLDVRPAFTGAGSPSFKAARGPKRLGKA